MFKAIGIRERPEYGLNLTPLKQRTEQVLRAGVEGIVGHLCMLSGLTQIFHDRRKFYYLQQGSPRS